MKATPWRRRLTLVVLGLATGLGHAPIGWWFTTVAALGLIIMILSKMETKRAAFGASWWAGLGYFALGLRWIIEPFLVDIEQYGWMAPFALILMSGGAALFWGLAGATATRLSAGNVWVLAGAISAAEIARSLLFTGFPWALLGHVWIDTPFAQAAAFAGPHGLTLFLLFLTAALVEIGRRSWIFGTIPLLALGLWVALDPADIQPLDGGPIIRIVQPNVPQSEKWDPVLKVGHFKRMLALSSGGTKPVDLIVWPETAVAQLLERAQSSIDEISETVSGTPLITGVQRRAYDDVYHNSLILIGRGGTIDGTYDKQHLVPFGEYFPGGEVAARLGLRGFASSEGAGFTVGRTSQLLDIPGIGQARPLICYEGIFSEEISADEGRARFLLLITNDAWFGKDAGPTQHLAQARLRAIEQGLPMVRAANTGISAMIDAQGRVLASLPLDTAGSIDVVLPEALAPTFYVKLGDIPAILATLLLLLAGMRPALRNSD